MRYEGYWLGKKRTYKDPLARNAKISEGLRLAYKNGERFATNPMKGKKHTEATKQKMREACLGDKRWNWIKDRSVVERNKRNDPEYQQWVKKVKKRDNGICKINNKDCSGYCVVHHILSWSEYPELRYNINNGITLCRAHHPRKRAEEKESEAKFLELIQVSGVLI
jgi:hypothetical protein